MTLREKQSIFMKLLVELFDFIHESGYEITGGELWRSEAEAIRRGFRNSNHTRRIAIDINLFKNGVWLQNTEDHKVFGEFWESLGEKYGVVTCWGGRFNDGNHYSIEHNGVK